MTDFHVHVPKAVLTAALHDVAGVELDVSNADWETESARCVQRLMSEPEKAERLAQLLEEHSLVQEDAVAWPENPGQLRLADITGPDDGLFDNLPTGAAEDDMFSIGVGTGVENSVSEFLDRLAGTDQSLTTGGNWAAPSVLGFPDVEVQIPIQSVRINRVLGETRRRLERRAFQKPSLSARILTWVHSMQQSTDWVIASHRLARNCTVVETSHGLEKMVLQSVASGPYLYIVLVTKGAVTVKNRLSLDDEEASIRQLEEVLADHGEAAQKALGELRFSLK